MIIMIEVLSSSLTQLYSSPSASIPIFFPKLSHSLRFSTFPCFSKKNDKDANSDLHSNSNDSRIVPLFPKPTLSQEEAMGLVLSAAGSVRGWTTGSGMEGPSTPIGAERDLSGAATLPCSLFTKSPRRRMRGAFTCKCNVCGQRTTRAINPHAYTDGTVFVQCCGFNVFHKLVDNLKLFHEMKTYVNPSVNYQGPDMGVDLEIDDNDGGGDNSSFPPI